jgi:hypothetical protein
MRLTGAARRKEEAMQKKQLFETKSTGSRPQ